MEIIETLESVDDDDFELMDNEEISSLEIEELESENILEEFEQLAENFFDTSLQSKIPMFLRLTRRTVVFLFFMMLGFITFFIIGNYQHFLDSDMKLILQCATINAIMLATMSIFAFIESLICIATERKIIFVFYSVAFILAISFSIVFGITSNVIRTISEGLSL